MRLRNVRGEVKKKNWLTVKWKRLTILKIVVRSEGEATRVEWVERCWYGNEKVYVCEKELKEKTRRNFPWQFPWKFCCTSRKKVMSGIMRVIVVDSIESEWMDLIALKQRRPVSMDGINSIMRNNVENELRFVRFKWRRGERSGALMTCLIKFLFFECSFRALFIMRRDSLNDRNRRATRTLNGKQPKMESWKKLKALEPSSACLLSCF